MMNKILAPTLAFALGLALLSGCTQPAQPVADNPGESEAVELRVAAATTLRNAFDELATAFEEAHNARLVFSFGASGALQKQIEGGVPADVFASASAKQVDALAEGGFVSVEETTTFASNDLVIIVGSGNPLGISAPGDLSKANRLTTGNPDTAPFGTLSKEWLESLGLWEGLEDRFVFAENAAQSTDYIARGEVDAGLGFASEVLGTPGVEVAYTVPVGQVRPVRYVAAPLASSDRNTLAHAFVEYLLSDEAQRVLAEHGFKPAPEPR